MAARIRVGPHHFAAALRRVRPSSLRGLCPEVPTASWKDVGGLVSVKRQLRELIELPLKRPELLTKFGMRPARGALLYGPPGELSLPSPPLHTPKLTPKLATHYLRALPLRAYVDVDGGRRVIGQSVMKTNVVLISV